MKTMFLWTGTTLGGGVGISRANFFCENQKHLFSDLKDYFSFSQNVENKLFVLPISKTNYFF